MLQEAYKKQALNCTQVYDWYRQYKDGRMSIQDGPRPDCSSTSRKDKNADLTCETINQDHQITID